jgi:hypothetical protein
LAIFTSFYLTEARAPPPKWKLALEFSLLAAAAHRMERFSSGYLDLRNFTGPGAAKVRVCARDAGNALRPVFACGPPVAWR